MSVYEANGDDGETVVLFGNFRKEDKPNELTYDAKLCAKWLSGKDIAMSPRVKIAIRKEFRAQEQFRQHIRGFIREVTGVLRDRAHKARDEIGVPISTHQQFDQGLHIGEYNANARAAQLVADILNAVELELTKL